MDSARITTPAIEALVADNRRVVPLFAVHNFRDLGGYPTADGRETRWRTLFRADGLYRLTPDDTQSVVDLGVTTVVDLRSDRGATSNQVAAFARTRVGMIGNVDGTPHFGECSYKIRIFTPADHARRVRGHR